VFLHNLLYILFHLQVAHFEPETIHLYGEAIFPRIFLNLPRDSVTSEYERLLCTARENLLKDANRTADNSALTDNSALSELDAANAAGSSLLVVLIVLLDSCNFR